MYTATDRLHGFFDMLDDLDHVRADRLLLDRDAFRRPLGRFVEAILEEEISNTDTRTDIKTNTHTQILAQTRHTELAR